MDGELQDWELLPVSVSDPDSPPRLRNLDDDDDQIGADSEGIIKSDYFTLDNNRTRYERTAPASEEGSLDSDNPSWIDPGSDTRFLRKNSGEFWSDSGSDNSDGRKFSDYDANNCSGISEIEARVAETGGFGEMESKLRDYAEIEQNNDGKASLDVHGRDLPTKLWSDSGGGSFIEEENGDGGKMSNGLGNSGEEDDAGNRSQVESDGEGIMNGNESVGDKQTKCVRSASGEEKRTVVWWKVPLEILKYCVVRVSPFWSVPVAVAFMGCVILGRRLYKMRRKSQSLQLKVTMDDKKVSHLMTHAARLNEAFSVVRRVPIIRPSIPAAGVNTWPVMSLR